MIEERTSPSEAAGDEETHGDGRQDQCRKPTSDNGYPAENITKHIDEHHSDPEGRKGHAYQRQHHAGRVDPSIGLHTGKNSKHEPNRQADSKTAEGQFEGRTGLLEIIFPTG